MRRLGVGAERCGWGPVEGTGKGCILFEPRESVGFAQCVQVEDDAFYTAVCVIAHSCLGDRADVGRGDSGVGSGHRAKLCRWCDEFVAAIADGVPAATEPREFYNLKAPAGSELWAMEDAARARQTGGGYSTPNLGFKFSF